MKKNLLPHLIAIAIFVFISVVYCLPLFEGNVLLSDDTVKWKGASKEVVDHREEMGEEPLWTNGMFSGMPAYQVSTKSNANLIQYVDKILQLGLPRPMNLIFMYLIGFYILLLTLKIDYKIAIVGAIAFAFSSYFFIILQFGHMTKAHAIAYIPLIIASVLYTFRKTNIILGATFTALFVALQLYCNHYQITYYTGLILMFIGIVHFFKELKEGTLFSFLKISAILIFAAMIGAGTNFTRLYTTMEYSPYSQRGQSELGGEDNKEDGVGLGYQLAYSYGKLETMSLFVPNIHGGAAQKMTPNDKNALMQSLTVFDDLNLGQENSKAYPYYQDMLKLPPEERPSFRSYFGDQPLTAPTYVGAIVFFLFVLGLFIVKSNIKKWVILSTILAIMLAWGSNFQFFAELFYDYFPSYNRIRAITMSLVIAEFSIALLATLALHQFLISDNKNEGKKRLKRAFYISGGITLFIYLFAWYLPGFDFLSDGEVAGGYTKDIPWIKSLMIDRYDILKSDALRSFLFILMAAVILWFFIKDKIKKEYVILIFGCLILSDMWFVNKRYLNSTHFGPEHVFEKTAADKKILKSNSNQERFRVFNLNNPYNESRTSYFHSSIGGYSAVKLKRYEQLYQRYMRYDAKGLDNVKGSINKLDYCIELLEPSVLSMLNTKWIISPDTKNKLGVAIQTEDVGLNVPLGNAWFVDTFETVNSAGDELHALYNFNPARKAIVDKKFSSYISDFNYDSSSTISLIEYSLNKLIYQTENIKSDQLAVFSEIYYEKGWNAYIDNKLVPHFRVNYVLRAMMVPKGTKNIEFRFEPNAYSVGENVALASSILLLLMIGFVSYKEFKKS